MSGKIGAKMGMVSLALAALTVGCGTPMDGDESGLKLSSGNYWTSWIGGNQNGTTRSASWLDNGWVTALEGREQAGYGLVNLRVVGQTDRGTTPGYWSTDNHSGSFRSTSQVQWANGLSVRIQGGHGVINAHLLGPRNSSHLTSNYNGSSYGIRCYDDDYVIGIQTREQAGYGVVDARVFCRSR